MASAENTHKKYKSHTLSMQALSADYKPCRGQMLARNGADGRCVAAAGWPSYFYWAVRAVWTGSVCGRVVDTGINRKHHMQHLSCTSAGAPRNCNWQPLRHSESATAAAAAH